MSSRKKLTPEKLVDFLTAALADENPCKAELVRLAGSKGSPPPEPPAARADGDTEEATPTPEPPEPPTPPTAAQQSLPETEAYAHLLVLLHLVDAKNPAAKDASVKALERMSTYNRRTLDVLHARLVFYYSLAHEMFGELSEVRPALLSLHRTAALRYDEIGQETILNLLLRNFLHYNLYDQAEKLRSKAQLPASRSNQQQCRYLYYLGRIRAVQLEYSEAKECLTQALRKAPTLAKGFSLELVKWITVVRLLLGEIPEKKDLTEGNGGRRAALKPYLDLTQAVRLGDLEKFRVVMERHGGVFATDKTTNLITRLRRNVIRTGLRRINLAYSSISLADVSNKLGLAPGEDDVECIVAKAIRDGGIDAAIDHEAKLMYSKETVDIYSTQEPQAAFHARIAFCLDTHNEAVKAMRYASGPGKKKDNGEKAKERNALEAELAMHIMDDDEMDEF